VLPLAGRLTTPLPWLVAAAAAAMIGGALWAALAVEVRFVLSNERLVALAEGDCPRPLAADGLEARLVGAVMASGLGDGARPRVGTDAWEAPAEAGPCALPYRLEDGAYGLLVARYGEDARLATLDVFDALDERLAVGDAPSWRIWLVREGTRTYVLDGLHGRLYLMRGQDVSTLRPVGRRR
jgi:hypothetical protein